MIQKPSLPSGLIEIWSLDPARRLERLLTTLRNTRTYEGSDGLASIAAGLETGSINAMYFGFSNSGSPSTVATSANSRADDFRALNGIDADFVRVRLSPGVADASAVEYEGNRINFAGIASSGSEGELGLTMIGGTADITHMGLVIAPDWNDNTQDYLYAVSTPSGLIAVPALTGVGFRWQTTFTIP